MNFTDKKKYFSNKNQIMIEGKYTWCRYRYDGQNFKGDRTFQYKEFIIENWAVTQ